MTLVHLLEEKLGKKALIQLLPYEPGEVLVTYADISKSQSMLGFTPQVSLKEGLDRFLEWYHENDLINDLKLSGR